MTTTTSESASVAHGILDRIQDSFSAATAYGPAVEADGVTVIPAVSISAGGGGGSMGGASDREGGGFGARTTPIGAYVVTGGKVRWRPAIDLNRWFVAGCSTAVAYFVFAWLSRRSANG